MRPKSLLCLSGALLKRSRSQLCTLLRRIFGVDCSTPEVSSCHIASHAHETDASQTSFTGLPNDRFSHSAAFQFYQQLDSLAGLVDYAAAELCPKGDDACVSSVSRLNSAASVDISYDTISHALKITALWPHGRQLLQATSQPSYRTEVGVLGTDKLANLEPHELGISGHLTVLGQDKKPSQTAFAISSRHRHADSTFSSKFLEPTGLHPVLQLRLTSNEPPAEDTYCSAHAYLTLPRTIFADKYQLGDALFLASKNLTALRHTTQPVDLEAPEYATTSWGSAVLLELSPPKTGKPEPWTAEIPLHLRYLSPEVGGYRSAEIPYPVVFWACAAEEGTKFSTNPFDRVNLGYDGLFGPRTVFWHVDPQVAGGAPLTHNVTVPVLDAQKTAWVNIGTAAVVFLGFAWVVFRLVAAFLRTGYIDDAAGPVEATGKGKKEKKEQ